MARRLHISLDDDLVQGLDARVGRRGRSAFVGAAVRAALEEERRWQDIEAALGTLPDEGHDWDSDVADWVVQQRGADPVRLG